MLFKVSIDAYGVCGKPKQSDTVVLFFNCLLFVAFLEFSQEEEVGLAKHNQFRKVHQVPAMTLNRKMCDEAKKYAEKLVEMGTLRHSDKSEREGQGENLSMGCSSDAPQAMETAVENW